MTHVAGRKIRISEYVEIEWLYGRSAVDTCPNCGYHGEVEQILEADFIPPDKHFVLVLQVCPHCTVRFVDDVPPMDYAAEELIELGWHTYQAQIGAGIWPIATPLVVVDKPPGARVLEIGGGYGFGLDFAVQALGWQGRGYDPSPLGVYGRQELGIDLRQEYFTEETLKDGKWDVIVATEVIEHLDDPPSFLRLMRAAIADDGVMVLTTPDAACLTPDLSDDELVSPLAAGAHLVLQTARSLRMALEQAGFPHVEVRCAQMGLTAYASLVPLTLRDDEAETRSLYREYLARRAALASPGSDTQLGFATRELFDATNDGDFDAADTAWTALRSGVRRRYAFDIASLTALPTGCATASLSELAALMPLGLGQMLFARAMCLLAREESRVELRPLFQLVIEAVSALQQALAQRALDDKLADAIVIIARKEELLCAAETGEPGAVAALLALGETVTGWRAFIALVNAGEFAMAAELKAGLLPELPAADVSAGLKRDVLLSLANFHLAPGADAALAFPPALALAAAGEDIDAIVLGAFTRLVNASRYKDAQDAAATYGVEARATNLADTKTGHDARLALLVLDLAAGDPAEVPGRLADLALEPDRHDTLLLEAFIRLVNASRYTEALAYIATHDVQALADRLGGDVARNTGLGRMVLDLAVGDPAEIPGRLAGLDLEPDRRDTLLLEAFIRLVNASRYAEALAFIATHDVQALANRLGGDVARNTGLARTMLDLAVGDPAEVPARLAGLDIEPARHDTLLLEAFIRLVNASRYDEALAYIATHDVAALAARVGGETAKNTGLARTMLDLAVGDPAEVPARLAGLDIEPARHDTLLLEAFIRLVNASRYAEALAYIATHDVQVLADRVGGETAKNTGLARLVLDLAVGDPAEVPARLAGLDLEPDRRDTLLLEAFIRLVNASRYTEALAYIATHDVQALADRLGGETATNTGLARTMLDLAVGDPAEVPARVAGLALEQPQRETLLLEAFIRLVNASRYTEALAYIATHDVPALADRVGGETARNTGLARTMLDLAVGDPAEVPARLAGLALEQPQRETLLLEAFIRLANAARHAEAQGFIAAHDIPALLSRAAPVTAADAAVGLAVVELALGDPALVPAHLARAAVDADRATALTLAAFTGLVNARRYAEAEAFAATQPVLADLATPTGEAATDARIAAVLLHLHQGREAEAAALAQRWEPLDGAETMAPFYAEAFLRLLNAGDLAAARALAADGAVSARLAYCTQAARLDSLGALVFMDAQPGGDATLLPARLDALAAGGADEPLLWERTLGAFTLLVNGAQFEAARALAPRFEPDLAKRRPPFLAIERDALFATGMLFLQDVATYPRAALALARLRDDLVKAIPPGGAPHPLFWPALRGEVVALIPLKRGEEAIALLQAFTVAYTGAPDDLLQHLQKQTA